jgi:hypothetical protein
MNDYGQTYRRRLLYQLKTGQDRAGLSVTMSLSQDILELHFSVGKDLRNNADWKRELSYAIFSDEPVRCEGTYYAPL